MCIPYKRFAVAQLFLGKTPDGIVETLRKFGYQVVESQIKDIFDDMRLIMPESIRSVLNEGRPLSLSDDISKGWVKHYDALEYMEYAIATKNKEEEIPYQKSFKDIIWIHNHKAVSSLINVFLYNEEPIESISAVVQFKFKKKISQQTLKLYEKYYWDSTNLSALDALRVYTPFRDNALTLALIKDGQDHQHHLSGDPITNHSSQVHSEVHDGCSTAVIFRDSNYIKWKLGYKEVKAPSTKDFLSKVKADCAYLYEEAKSMTQSISKSHTEGQSMHPETGELVDVKSTSISYKNVTQEKLRIMKNTVDMYIKADKAIPMDTDDNATEKFFERLEQMSLTYDVEKAGQLVTGEDAEEILEDILGDKVI